MSDLTSGTVHRECPVRTCFWDVEVCGTDAGAYDEADAALDAHYRDEHTEKAKVRVVLEREVRIDHDQELSDVLDDEHDGLDEKPPGDYEVAFAYGEVLDQ